MKGSGVGFFVLLVIAWLIVFPAVIESVMGGG